MSSTGRFSNMQPLFSASPDRPKKSKYDVSPEASPRMNYNSVTLDPLNGGGSRHSYDNNNSSRRH